MVNLFGWEFKRKEDTPKENVVSFVPRDEDEGAVTIAAGGGYGQYLDLDGTVRSEAELVTKYREMSLQPECDTAIDEIVNESIAIDEEHIVNINLDEVNLKDNIKTIVRNEFSNVLNILDFQRKAYDIYRRWYIDGRLYYHVIIDEKDTSSGILELRYIDPRKIRKIKEVVREPVRGAQDPGAAYAPKVKNEYFIFNNRGFNFGNKITGPITTGIKIANDSICYVTSGLTDSNGTMVLSYLHKGIKALNQLRTLEDALVIYRLARAPERRIWYIDVGNLPKIKAEQYVRDIMVKHKNKLIYDSCFAMDTKIPLLDGRILSIKEIQKEFEQGKRLWVYSVDPITGKFSPGLVTSAGVTKFNQKVLKITLDNEKTITCTYDHKFPVHGRGKVEAQDLNIGDSMFPFYSKNKPIHKGNSTYQQIFDIDKKKWLFTHRLVSQWKDENHINNEFIFLEKFKDELKNTVHHMDYDRYNNTPENLMRMSKFDHFSYHKQHNSLAGKIGGKMTAQRKKDQGIPFFNITKEKRKEIGKKNGSILGKRCVEEHLGIFSLTDEQKLINAKKGGEKFAELMKNDDYRLARCSKIQASWTDKKREEASQRGKKLSKEHFIKMSNKGNVARWNSKNRKIHSLNQKIEFTDEIISFIENNIREKCNGVKIVENINCSNLLTDWIKINSEKNIKQWGNNPKFKFSYLNKIAHNKGFNGWKEYRDSVQYRNHKIINIEYLDERIDVGTLGIDKNEIYHNYHTFALDAGIYTFNSTGQIRDDRKFMTMLEDYWLPRREGGKGTEVTNLPGGQTLGQLDDVLYFQKRFYNTLNVPVNRLNSDMLFSIGRATEVTRDEVKFSKFVTRLRTKFCELFTSLLGKQLILKKVFSVEDWDDIVTQIRYDFSKDNYFAELKDAEIITGRINLAQLMENMAGKYYSQNWIRKNILKQTDEDIEEMDKEIETELNSEDPRWINPVILQNEMLRDQIEMGVGPNGMPSDGSVQDSGPTMQPTKPQNTSQPNSKPDTKNSEKMHKIQQAVSDYHLLQNKKNRSLADESRFKSASQILAKNK